MTTQFFPCTHELFPDDDRLDIADILAVASNELTSSFRLDHMLAYRDDDS